MCIFLYLLNEERKGMYCIEVDNEVLHVTARCNMFIEQWHY